MPPKSPVPPVPTTPSVRRRPARRFSATLFWAVVGAFAALFVANLAGFGPAIVKHEKVRVVLPPQKAAQPPAQPVRPATPRPIPAAPAHAVTPPSTPKPPAPALVSEAIINIYSTASVPQPVPPPQVVQPQVKPSAGFTLQLNIFGNGWGGPQYYGSTYGWTPGHEELRYDPRTGTYYRVWVAHPHPGY